MRYGHLRRLAALTLTAVTAAGVLAACGSSSSTSSSSSSASAAAGAGAAGAGGAANRAKLVACLKQHGVTLPTRPPGARPAGGGTGTAPGGTPPTGSGAAGGGRRGFFGGGAAGGRFSNPKFQAAFKACGAAGGFGRRGGTPERASITKFVTCVSQHGYTLPKPNFSGKGPVFPAKIETNPKFVSASRACQAQLRPAAGSASGGGGAPPSGA
jgi:hypothetical protein